MIQKDTPSHMHEMLINHETVLLYCFFRKCLNTNLSYFYAYQKPSF